MFVIADDTRQEKDGKKRSQGRSQGELILERHVRICEMTTKFLHKLIPKHVGYVRQYSYVDGILRVANA